MKRLCSKCSASIDREELVVKRAMFVEFGTGGKTIRSRVVAWLCPACLKKDTDWARDAYTTPEMEALRDPA